LVAGAAGDGLVASAISAAPIDMAGMLAGAHHPGAGAVVLFSGEVRENNRGRAVAFLEYEAATPLAEKLIAEILAVAGEKWGLHMALARHRVGRVGIGDIAVVVITASTHRAEAYAANRYIIDRIKHEAPIWKCEHFTDGTSEWGNNCNCHAVTGDVSKGKGAEFEDTEDGGFCEL
jgi:molybdopterin synthase catalytic subunit